MWIPLPVMAFPLLLLLLFCSPRVCLSQSSGASASSSDAVSLKGVPGCGGALDPVFRFLCDRGAGWGIVLQVLASAGFLLSLCFLLGLLVWFLSVWVSSRHQRGGPGATLLCLSLFLLSTAGIFATTFSFIVGLGPHTCPARVFLFSVLSSLAFSCLLARCLAMLGFAAARDWGEPGLVLGLFAVQVVISAQWLLIVLVREEKPCLYSQEEFAMLQIYVLCLLLAALVSSFRVLRRSCYGYGGVTHQQWRGQAVRVCLTLLLSACIWVVWIAMLTRGNPEMRRRPAWDDPVLGIALVANGWVLLVGHGLPQVASFCSGEAYGNDSPLNFSGWRRGGGGEVRQVVQNGSAEKGSQRSGQSYTRGRPEHEPEPEPEPGLRSPYESGFSMTGIDPDKDYSIPRPQTTNLTEPYI